MKTFKRIMAITGAVLLVSLYITTLIFAITDNSAKMGLFIASIVATGIVPVVIWAAQMIYNLLKKRREDQEEKLKKETSNLSDHLTIHKNE